MAWETTGTVTVTNNSSTVSGSGTLFSDRCRVGDAFNGPDGTFYEVVNIVSNTSMAISPSYKGASGSGKAYQVVPVRGYSKKAADYLHELLRRVGPAVDNAINLPEWITAGLPAPVEAGGTGASTAAGARTALSVFSKAEISSALDLKANLTDGRFTNAREWTAATMSEAEAAGGTAQTRRAVNSKVLRQSGVASVKSMTEQKLGQSEEKLVSQKVVTENINRIDRALGGYVPFIGVYGLEYNEASDTYVRTGSQNFTAIQSQMKRCLLLPDGTVDYFLSAENSNYKADGSPANITGANGYLGNVMVQIPKYYRKITTVGDVVTREVSLTPAAGFTLHPAFIKAGVEVDYRYYRAYQGVEIGGKLRSVSGAVPTRSKNISQFRALAKANGSDWHQNDWMLLDAIRELSSIEIGTFRSQDVLGQGNSTGANYDLASGMSNSIGNGSSTSATAGWMSYRGIENFYASIWEFIDGINVRDHEPFVNANHKTFASDVFTGDYVSTGVTQPTANGYISAMHHTDKGFFVKAAGGGTTTFFADYYSQNTGNRIWLHGGGAHNAAYCGSFYSNANDSSSVTYASVGAGIAF